MKAKTMNLKTNHIGEKLSDHYRYLLVMYLKPLWPQVVILGILLLGTIGLQLINPQIMRYFIDTIAGDIDTNESSTDDLLLIGSLFLGIAVLQQIFGVLSNYVSTNLAWLATNRLRFDLARHCLHLDMSFHNQHTPGEMITRIDNDTNALSRFFSQFIVRMASQSLFLVGVLLVLFFEDWRVGVILTSFSLVALYIIWRLKHISVPHWRAWSQASAKLYGFLEERLNGIDDIRTAGAKSYVLNGFFTLMRAFMKIGIKASLINNITMNTTMVLFAVGNAIAFIVGAWLFLNNTITIGAVYIIFHYSAMLAGPIQSLAMETQNLQSAGGSVERIVELLNTESKLSLYKQNENNIPLTTGPLAVIFQNVSFQYDSKEKIGAKPPQASSGKAQHANGNMSKTGVLNNISFQLLPGRSLGLLGRTGSGKTTLARLIFRLYDADSGRIRIGRDDNFIDISQFPLPQLRKQIGLVTQNIELFNASVYENLTFFDDSISKTKILDVLQKIGLWDWYQSLPHGLDTKISSGGKELSAGQGQLLAFARIFLRDPKIVILDEASSRLDPATEKLIEAAVKWLLQDRTAIIIAHRLSTIQNVDEIMIMEEGKIVEYGEREMLVNDSHSIFSGLLQTSLQNSPILSD